MFRRKDVKIFNVPDWSDTTTKTYDLTTVAGREQVPINLDEIKDICFIYVRDNNEYYRLISDVTSGTTRTLVFSGAKKITVSVNGTVMTVNFSAGADDIGETDTTLKLSGVPADAKATGDAIDEINESLESVNYVTPQMYGAKANGTTDDTTSIQNALNYLNEKGGGIIYFPSGTYLINSSVQSYPNITALGEGKGSVIKIGVSEVSFITANNNIVENISFDGNATVLSDGIYTRNIILRANGSNIIIKDCYFSDAIGSCIGSSQGTKVKVIHNTINGYGDHAIYFSTNSSDIVVTHNIINRPDNERGYECIKFRERVNNICVANNIASNVPCFIMIATLTNGCNNAIIIGNRATTINHAVLLISETSGVYHENIIISNNVFENIGQYNALTLFRNDIAGCRNTIISNNVFKNYNAVGDIRGTLEAPIENISVVNNIFDFGEHLTGIAFTISSAKNLRYVGNTFVATSITTFMSTQDNAECEFRDNYFNLSCVWLLTCVNRSNIKIMFNGNTIKQLSRRLINDANITGNSLIVITNNNILNDSTTYPYFYDRSTVTDPTKYLIKGNIVNGANYEPSMIAYIPSYVGQICVDSGIVYVATGTTATTDWIALNTTV